MNYSIKKNLNYEFQIYMIQQILLCLQTVNNFDIDIIKVNIDMGNNSVTDAFKTNYEPIIKGTISVRQMLASFRPEIMETTKDFKKILYNNLLKAYKMFINLANEFVYGIKLLDIYSAIPSFIFSLIGSLMPSSSTSSGFISFLV